VIRDALRCFLIVCPILAVFGCTHRIEAPEDLDAPARELTVEQFVAPHKVGPVENGWLFGFDDKRLNEYVAEAMAHNPDLVIAASNADRAKAQSKLAAAAMKPSVNYGGRVSETSTGTDLSFGGVGAVWEPDLWGRLSAQVQSAQATQRSVEADYAGARQALAGDVCRAWFALIEATRQEGLADTIRSSYDDLLSTVETKYRVGQVLRKDVAQAQADYDSANDAYLQAQNARQIASRSMEILLGRYPSAGLVSEADLPRLPSFPESGVPADLLQRRPDLVASEEALRAAFFSSKEAQLARLPRFTLSLRGLSSSATGFLAQLGAGVSGPLYEGGAIEAQIESADAQQRAMLAAHQGAVLNAFKDVEASLDNETFLQQRIVALSNAVASYTLALQDTRIQYDVGQVDLAIVQLQQAKLAGAQMTLVHVQTLLLQNRVNMYLALGGGFDDQDALGRDSS
jgi:NodT family efflux transporter outer membrane factor (OMF) lipoprotein